MDAASGNLSVNQLVAALGTLDVASLGTVGIIGKVTEGLWDMAKAATETSVGLTALNEITGSDPKIVLQWERAAERLHISGKSVISMIASVQKMNNDMAAGRGTPAVVGQFLGMDPAKAYDANGKVTAYKDAMDYIREMAQPNSRYQHLGAGQQQYAVGQLFGGDADNAFRLIKDVVSGKFRPQDIHGLNDKQISELNKTDAQWTAVKQDVTGLFEKFLTGTDTVQQLLTASSQLLEAVNKILDMPSVRGALHEIGEAGANVINGKVLGMIMGEQNTNSTEDAFMKSINNRITAAGIAAGTGGAGAVGKPQEVKVKLDINDKTTPEFRMRGVIYAEASVPLGNNP